MYYKPSPGQIRLGLIVVLGMLPSFAPAAGNHYSWTPTYDNNWGDYRNWTPAAVPGAGDHVTVSGTVYNGGAQNLASLTVHSGAVNLGNLTATVINLNGGSLNVDDCTVDTLNHVAGGLNSSTMTLAAAGTWTWTGGWINATTITIPSTAAVDISGGQVVLGGSANLNNSGTTTISGGPLQGYENSVFNNLAGGKCVLSSATPFNHYYGGNVFNNNGVLEVTSGTSDLRSFTFNLNAETRCTGGDVQITGTANIPGGSTFTGSGTTYFQGDVRLNGSADATAGNVVLSGGTLTATNPAQIVGTLSWTAGTIASNLTVPVGSLLVTSGPDVKGLGGGTTLDNYGTTRWLGGGAIQSYENVTIHNHSGGRFEIAADGTPLVHYYGGNVFENDGLLTKNGGVDGVAVLQSHIFNLNGELNCDNGTVQLDSRSNLAGGSTITGTAAVHFDQDVHVLGVCTETIADLRFTAGTVTGTAPGGFAGTLTWDHGTINGVLDVPAGAFLEVTGESDHYLGISAVLNVNGTLRWLGPGPFRGYDLSVLNILPGGVFDAAADGVLLDDYYATNTFNLEGRLVKSAGTGTTTVQYWTIHATGEIVCETGTLAVDAITHLEGGCQFSGAGTTTIGGTTYLDGLTTCTPQIHITSGNFHGNGGILTGDILWKGGTLWGTTVVGPAGHMVIDGPGIKYLTTNAVLQVAGEVDFEEGIVQGHDVSRIEVLSGGQFDVNAPVILNDYYATNTINVQAGGQFNATTGSDLYVEGWKMDNDGTVTVNDGGQVDFHHGGTSSGTYLSEAGGLLVFANGDQNLNAGGTTTGPGEIRVAGGRLIANDTVIDGLVHLKGGQVGSTGDNGEFRLKDASTWDTGHLFGNVSIPAGNTFLVDGDTGLRRMNVFAELTNHGTLRWDGTGPIEFYEKNSLVNEAGGRIELRSDGIPFSYYYGGSELVNHGTIEKMAGPGDAEFIHHAYRNDGVIRANSGRILVSSDLELNNGGQIDGTGRVTLGSARSTIDGTTTVSNGVLELGGAEIFGHASGTGTLAGSAIEWTAGQTKNIVTLAGIVTTPGAGTKSIGVQSEVRVGGLLTVNGTGNFEGYEAGTVRVLPAGTFHVTGSAPITEYYGGGNTFINEGTLRLGVAPVRIVMPWHFSQAATGRLEVDIAGMDSAAPEFDILHATRSVSLAGTIVPTVAGGYDPPVGTEFLVVTTTGGLGGSNFNTVAGNRFSRKASEDGRSVILRALAVIYDYDTWATENNLTGPDADQGANPDGDQFTNFEEYAFNLNPNKADVLDMTTNVMVIDSQQWLVLPYLAWQNRLDAGLIYWPVNTTDLSNWVDTGVIDELDPNATPVTGAQTRRARVLITPGTKFLRIDPSFPSSN